MQTKVPPVVVNKKRDHPLEKVVEAYLKKEVGKLGGKSWKFSSPNNRGVFDQIMVIDGLTLFVEVKRVKGKISPKQESFYDSIMERSQFGCFVFGHAGVDAYIGVLKSILAGTRAAAKAGCLQHPSQFTILLKKEYR